MFFEGVAINQTQSFTHARQTICQLATFLDPVLSCCDLVSFSKWQTWDVTRYLSPPQAA